jgi:tight adherence protein C
VSFPLLCSLLIGLTVVGAFALYEAVWGSKVALGDRLFDDRHRVSTLKIGERFSDIVRRSARRDRAGSKRPLHGTLSYAGFRGFEVAVTFQILRAAMMGGLAMLGFTLSAIAGKSPLIGLAIGCVLGYVLPTFVVSRLSRSRKRRILSELPDVLALLVVCLEAGTGFGEVIKLVGRELERQGRVLGQELSATASQMAAGRSLEDSLKDLGERNGVDELKSLVALAIQSERVGARMAPSLRASADLLNSRRRLAAEEAASKTAVKMLVPLVFLILPAMMIVVLGPAVIQIVHMFHHRG